MLLGRRRSVTAHRRQLAWLAATGAAVAGETAGAAIPALAVRGATAPALLGTTIAAWALGAVWAAEVPAPEPPAIADMSAMEVATLKPPAMIRAPAAG